MVTHDIELASKTDRALILKDGLIFQEIIKPKSEELTKALGIETDVGRDTNHVKTHLLPMEI